jgi:hypothetical protein
VYSACPIEDAPIFLCRQDDYLGSLSTPCSGAAAVVQFHVQIRAQFQVPVNKFLPGNHLHFSLCTAERFTNAPILCVDVF